MDPRASQPFTKSWEHEPLLINMFRNDHESIQNYKRSNETRIHYGPAGIPDHFSCFSYFSLNSTPVSLIFQHVPSSLFSIYQFSSCTRSLILRAAPNRWLLYFSFASFASHIHASKLGLAVQNAELRDLSYQYNLFKSSQQFKVHSKYLPAA